MLTLSHPLPPLCKANPPTLEEQQEGSIFRLPEQMQKNARQVCHECHKYILQERFYGPINSVNAFIQVCKKN